LKRMSGEVRIAIGSSRRQRFADTVRELHRRLLDLATVFEHTRPRESTVWGGRVFANETHARVDRFETSGDLSLQRQGIFAHRSDRWCVAHTTCAARSAAIPASS